MEDNCLKIQNTFLDIDECAEGLAECDIRYGVCRNTRGSYDCSCPEGFKGDGKTCIEVDECVEGTHNCDEQAECSNTEGGFMCTCKDGFFGSGQTCVDENECRDTTLCSRKLTFLIACAHLPVL